METTYEKKISIIIVNYNVRYFLEQCLTSVKAAISGMDAEVFVVDNNSTDGSMEYLKPKFPEVIFIENKDNPGFSKANNQAIKLSIGEYILLLNPDTVIGEEIIRTLCFFMDEKTKAGAIGVKMLDGSGNFLPESKRCFPTPWISFCKIFGLSKMFPNSKRFARYSLPFLNPNKQHKVDVLSGAFMFIRHDALNKVGLLDENFFMYGEDIDLSYRIASGGYKNYYLPERILHYKGESTKHGDIKYIKAFYNAMFIFYKKHYTDSGKLMQLIIKMAVKMKTSMAVISGNKKKAATKKKQRRMLVLCTESNFEEIKAACSKVTPMPERIGMWNLGKHRAMEAISRRNMMNGYTDITFAYPDMRFEQMLLLMDSMPNKMITYHIYNKESGRLIAAGSNK